MGLTIVVNSTEDMCHLMCDNEIPKRRVSMSKRSYTKRLSQKAILEYLESIHPNYATFEEIADNLPILNIDYITLADKLYKLADGKKTEVEKEDGYIIKWRFKKSQ